MAIPRRELIDESKPGIYHTTTRCVRRAFLCGRDSYSGNDYEHRRAWIRDRMILLADVFAIDLLAYSVMMNHLHQVLRNRPDMARQWSAQEVARRWLQVASTHQSLSKVDTEPSEEEIARIAKNPRRVRELRKRLSSISWFMAKLNEYISRRANKEEKIGGRFWESRFKSSRLGNLAAVVACMIYVDLNPVRAKIAESLEDSDHTSAQDRIIAEQGRQRVRAYNKSKRRGESLTAKQNVLLAKARKQARRASFLLSFKSEDSPLAHMSEASYLELADWTGRQVRKGKPGVIPEHISPILESLAVNTANWVKTVERYGSLFSRLVACADDMAKAARAKGLRWFRGVAACREFYVGKSTVV